MDDLRHVPDVETRSLRHFFLLDSEPINLISIEETEPDASSDSLASQPEARE